MDKVKEFFKSTPPTEEEKREKINYEKSKSMTPAENAAAAER
jgi:hypothetical protein